MLKYLVDSHRPRPERERTAVGAMYATPGPPTVYAPNIVCPTMRQDQLTLGFINE